VFQNRKLLDPAEEQDGAEALSTDEVSVVTQSTGVEAQADSYRLEKPGPPTTKTASDLLVSEVFRSIQGEGASAGEKATFLRLAMCNLSCSWCDTPYTWDFKRYRKADEVHPRPIESIAEMLGDPERLIITGGEPLLQQKALASLLARIPTRTAVEVETNGTIAPWPALLKRVNQWNLSPKLPSSGETEERAIDADVLQTFLATGQAWLKLVVENDADLSVADDLIDQLCWPRERVLMMPQARTRVELKARAPWVEARATERGLAISPRLHILRWDQKRGI
jgi:7-carboxy-7-deazaguanine synthase